MTVFYKYVECRTYTAPVSLAKVEYVIEYVNCNDQVWRSLQ